MKNRTVWIRGTRYEIRFYNRLKNADGVELRGQCEPPTGPPPRLIQIVRDQSELMLLDTLIHEILHAAFWDMDEAAVAETATDMARILNALGFVRGGGDPWKPSKPPAGFV
jgi:hypothetical protein